MFSIMQVKLFLPLNRSVRIIIFIPRSIQKHIGLFNLKKTLGYLNKFNFLRTSKDYGVNYYNFNSRQLCVLLTF